MAIMGSAQRWWIAGAALAALAGLGPASAQIEPAPGTTILTLPPLGTPGTGTGSGTGGAGNSRLGGSVGGVPGMGRVTGPSSNGILMPGTTPGVAGGPLPSSRRPFDEGR